VRYRRNLRAQGDPAVRRGLLSESGAVALAESVLQTATDNGIWLRTSMI
jgi:hypothetical protein